MKANYVSGRLCLLRLMLQLKPETKHQTPKPVTYAHGVPVSVGS